MSDQPVPVDDDGEDGDRQYVGERMADGGEQFVPKLVERAGVPVDDTPDLP